MTGRGTKRRGRPPKTANMDRQSAKMNYSSKKPKYLADSQLSTPSASRASSPQGSDNGSANRRGRPSTSRKGGRGGGRGRKRGSGGHQNNKSYSRKSKLHALYTVNILAVFHCLSVYMNINNRMNRIH